MLEFSSSIFFLRWIFFFVLIRLLFLFWTCRIIFTKSVQRCMGLSQLLVEQNFPAIAIHSAMTQEERLDRYQKFKNFEKRLLVATDLFGRGKFLVHVFHSGKFFHCRLFEGVEALGEWGSSCLSDVFPHPFLRHGHWTRQHCGQLRLPHRFGHVSASRGARRPFRHQGSGHHLRQRRRRQQDHEPGAGPFRHQRPRVARRVGPEPVHWTKVKRGKGTHGIKTARFSAWGRNFGTVLSVFFCYYSNLLLAVCLSWSVALPYFPLFSSHPYFSSWDSGNFARQLLFFSCGEGCWNLFAVSNDDLLLKPKTCTLCQEPRQGISR